MSMSKDTLKNNVYLTNSLTATITIGTDGRVYFHDVTPDILAVASTICPHSQQVFTRQATQQVTGIEYHECNTIETQKE